MDMDQQEMVDTVRDAQEDLFNCISKLESVVQGRGSEGYWNAYLIDHLKIYASEGSGFMSADPSIDKLIEEIEKED
jgi:hypothetical protein